jgi:hypothetical protein
MRRFAGHIIGVDQGSVLMFSDFEDGGTMWTGQGPRVTSRRVTFRTPFLSAPVVQVGLSMWDVDNRQNMRVDIAADGVTREGFQLVFKTWGDTRVARVRADWMAIGELASDEDWDIH